MLTPSTEIITLLTTFASGMTAPTFANALILIYGAILAPGRRTVTSALFAMGMSEGVNFSKYHRVLSRAIWLPMFMSKQLLLLLIRTFVPKGEPLVFLIDETLERRRGKKILYKGSFRDAVRSTANRVVVSSGIRWCCVCLLVSVPWSSRKWALPFLVVPVLSEKTCKHLKKRQRSATWWAGYVVEKLREWLPDREITVVGDGGYSSIALIRKCQELNVRLFSRLRIDAHLYDFPTEQPSNKRGPKPKKGASQPSFVDRLVDKKTEWTQTTLPWYGGEEKTLEFTTGHSLWHAPGFDPVEIRWVLVRHEVIDKKTGEKKFAATAYLCSDPTASAEQILSEYVGRWNIEVTFDVNSEGVKRAHLGFETQRQWALRAIERTTPALFGLFSLVVLMAHALHPKKLPIKQTAWSVKEEATFSDALAAVRSHLWSALFHARNNVDSPISDDLCLIPRSLWEHVHLLLDYAA